MYNCHMDTKKTGKIVYFLFFPAFILIWIMLFWKCRFGFPSDEALYLLIPFRFINGDIPLLQEWHPTQISCLWIHPLVALFLKTTGSTEGIFLTFRYIFTAVWGLSSLFVFFRLRKLSVTGAAIASLMMFIYVPFGEMALYYNTIGLMTLIMSSAIVITAERIKPLQFVFSGMLYAVSVTCCPFFAVLLPAVIVFLAVRKFRGIKLFLAFLGGIAAVFLVFCIYFLSSSSVSDVISNLHHITGEREHQFSLISKLISYFTDSFSSTIGVTIAIAMSVLTFLIVYLHRSESSKRLGFVSMCITAAVLQVCFLIQNSYINNFMIAPAIIGLYCFLTSKDEKIKWIFLAMWIPGVIYSMCINISSNVGFEAVASALTISSVASAVIAAVYVCADSSGTSRRVRIICLIAAALFFSFQLGLELYFRYDFVFEYAEFEHMTEEIGSGSVKGIVSTPNRSVYYLAMADELSPLREGDYEDVLILSPETWMYLDCGKNVSSYTSWTLNIDDTTLDTLEEYYSLYPDKKPDIIYVEPYYINLVPRLGEWGYHGDQTALGGYVLLPDH